jgi:hypothetical protein
MKTIATALVALSVIAGIAGQASAQTYGSGAGTYSGQNQSGNNGQ